MKKNLNDDGRHYCNPAVNVATNKWINYPALLFFLQEHRKENSGQ